MIRDPKGTGENVLLWTYNLKPEVNLLSDFQIQQWIRDYMVANCKLIIGEAREKFATIASPQGGTQLNGGSLKTDGKAELERLEADLITYKTGDTPLTWITG